MTLDLIIFYFIHILDHSLFDCRVKIFWDKIWNFFFKKKKHCKIDKKCNFCLALWVISLRALVSETLFLNDPLFSLKTTFFSRDKNIFTVFLAFFSFENLVWKVVDQFSIRIKTGTGTGTAGNGMESNRNRTDGQIMEPQVSIHHHHIALYWVFF